MSTVSEIKDMLADIRDHYDKYVNNKYMKNIILKVELPHSAKHEMNNILINEIIYIDLKGTIEDLYAGIRAVSEFIREVRSKVLNNLSSYVSTSILSNNPSTNANDKVLMQMAIKNYPMNIRLLADKIYKLLTIVIDYDNVNFAKEPAYRIIKNFDEIGKNLTENSADK